MRSHSRLCWPGDFTTWAGSPVSIRYDMVRRSAGFLIRNGPVTQQERWEEASGYSPSTLAANIVALTCAAFICRARGDAATAEFIQDQADYLEGHIEEWTVTSTGTLGKGPYYMRILPELVGQENPAEDKEIADFAHRQSRSG